MGRLNVNKIDSNITNQQVWAVDDGTAATTVATITASNITLPLTLTTNGAVLCGAGITASFISSNTAPTVGGHLCNKTYVDATLAPMPRLVTILDAVYSRSVIPYTYTIPSQATNKYDMIVGNFWCDISGDKGMGLACLLQPGTNGVDNDAVNLCWAAVPGTNDGGSAYSVRLPFFIAIPQPTTSIQFYRNGGTQTNFSIQITQLIRFQK